MIRFSGIEVDNHIPGAILYTNHSAGVENRRYVPEVVEPEPAFKLGQVVEVVDKTFLRYEWQGVVTKVGECYIAVEFGKPAEGLNYTTYEFLPAALKLIHEAK